MLKRLIIMLILALCLPTLCLAQESVPTVEEVKTQIGENYVAYPQLTNLADETIQAKINDDIVASSGVTEHLVTLVTLGDSPWGLQVQYQVTLNRDGVFSVLISAEGKMPNKRNGQAYTALTYDLTTGDRLGLDSLFQNEDQTMTRLETQAYGSLSQELTGYTENSDFIPLPQDRFTLDETGITFWYEGEQFQLLSGYAGACQFRYEELQQDLRKDGLSGQLGLIRQPLSRQQAAQQVQSCVQAGALPGIPVQMGQSMTEVIDKYRLVRTPDEFPGGRYYLLEDPAFRDMLVISDAMESGYDHSVVEGIQMKRGGMAGLLIGASTRQDWMDILGQPQETIVFTDSMAYDYNLPAGQSDIYHFGEYELRLHGDENGVLRAIQLCR